MNSRNIVSVEHEKSFITSRPDVEIIWSVLETCNCMYFLSIILNICSECSKEPPY